MNSIILTRARLGAGRAGPLIPLVAAVAFACLPGMSAGGQFNTPGHILITDQFNNRVIEIDPAGTIVWSFGSGHGNTSAGAIVGTNDAERVGVNTLMSG